MLLNFKANLTSLLVAAFVLDSITYMHVHFAHHKNSPIGCVYVGTRQVGEAETRIQQWARPVQEVRRVRWCISVLFQICQYSFIINELAVWERLLEISSAGVKQIPFENDFSLSNLFPCASWLVWIGMFLPSLATFGQLLSTCRHFSSRS